MSAREDAIERLADMLLDAWNGSHDGLLTAEQAREGARYALAGLVAVDPALVEAVREARERHDALMKSTELDFGQSAQAVDDIARAERALADAVLEQLRGGR